MSLQIPAMGMLVLMHEPASQCAADYNDDGDLNFFDVSAFLVAFSNEEPSADLSGDGSFNFFDVSAFLTQFTQGCP